MSPSPETMNEEQRIAELHEMIAGGEVSVRVVADHFKWLLSALSRAREDGARLTSAVRWALGEEGIFSLPPEEVMDLIAAGRQAMPNYKRRAPLYWWRSELREKAFGDAARSSSESDERGTANG